MAGAATAVRSKGDVATAIAILRQRFGDRVQTGEAIRRQHSHTLTWIASEPPDAVVWPTSTEEVAEIVRIAAAQQVPIIPFGAGTSLEGHVNAPFGGISLDLQQMNAILSVNQLDLDATVQAGVSRKALNDHLRDLGLSVDVDDEALAEYDAYIAALVQAEGLVHGQPGEFDRAYFRHQMPGGMMGTMKRQLAEIRRLDLLPKVLDEVEQVRADLGYPIMVTPFSQVVGTMALMNVMQGERYKTIPDEVTRYVLGRFGQPTMPMDRAVEARIRDTKRARELEDEPHMASLDELRARIGRGYSDEEFLLRAVMPSDQVDAMRAAGPARRGYDQKTRPVMALMQELTARKGLTSIRIEKPGLKLELNGGR